MLENDEISFRFAVLVEGECENPGPSAAARKFGYSNQRYFQLLHAFCERGAIALQSHKPGPKRPYRRTEHRKRPMKTVLVLA